MPIDADTPPELVPTPEPVRPAATTAKATPEQERHGKAVALAAEALKADPAVAAIVGDRVTAKSRAALPCLVLSPKRYFGGPADPSQPHHADVEVDCRAGAEDEANALAVAVQGVLTAGLSRGALQGAVLNDTGGVREEHGGFCRADRYTLLIAAPKK